jgi:hypothetical protein
MTNELKEALKVRDICCTQHDQLLTKRAGYYRAGEHDIVAGIDKLIEGALRNWERACAEVTLLQEASYE